MKTGYGTCVAFTFQFVCALRFYNHLLANPLSNDRRLKPSFRIVIVAPCWQLGPEACCSNTLDPKHFAKGATVDIENSRSSNWWNTS